MIPFDGSALLAVLRAFYPDVSTTALWRARRERPEMFAAGALLGPDASVLRLPDGRRYSLVGDDGHGGRTWQMRRLPRSS